MNFKIRFADQIVGLFIILSLASLVFVLFMLGQSQRWFRRDVSFYTVLLTADGLSNNMAIQYRGFTIGHVRNFYLNENDDVEVVFYIFEEYHDRVRHGSVVDYIASPIGLGSQFQFHPGRGNVLPEGTLVPVLGSRQAQELIRLGHADVSRQDDGINVLLTRVNTLLGDLTTALGEGTSSTEIGRIVGSISIILEGLETIPLLLDDTVNSLVSMLDVSLDNVFTVIAGLQEDLNPALLSVNEILANVSGIIEELNKPDGLLYTLFDTEEDLYQSLVASLGFVVSILENLDTTVAFVPTQLPQLAAIIIELRQTLSTAEDVLTALTNNPLLRGGIPDRPEVQGSGTSPRDLRF